MGGNPSICDNPHCLCNTAEGFPLRDGGNLFPRAVMAGHMVGHELNFHHVRDIRDNRDPEMIGKEIIEQREEERKAKANGHPPVQED